MKTQLCILCGSVLMTCHSFPNDNERRAAWIEFVEKNGVCARTIRHCSKLCSRHFDPKDFSLSATRRVRLTAKAIPTVSLENCIVVPDSLMEVVDVDIEEVVSLDLDTETKHVEVVVVGAKDLILHTIKNSKKKNGNNYKQNVQKYVMRHINIDRKKDMPNVIPVKSNNNKLGYIGIKHKNINEIPIVQKFLEPPELFKSVVKNNSSCPKNFTNNILLSDKVMCSQCNKQGHSARDCHQMKSLITITKQNNCKEIDNGGIDLKTSCIINCCNCNDLINHDCKHKDDSIKEKIVEHKDTPSEIQCTSEEFIKNNTVVTEPFNQIVIIKDEKMEEYYDFDEYFEIEKKMEPCIKDYGLDTANDIQLSTMIKDEIIEEFKDFHYDLEIKSETYFEDN